MPDLLKRVLIPALAASVPARLAQRCLGGFVPIFMLHRMACPDVGVKGHAPEFLRGALQWLRRKGYRCLSLEETVHLGREQGRLPTKSVVFTMDDGFFDQGEIAGPLFAEYDCPVTYFTISDFIGGTLWPWDDQVAYAVENTEIPSVRFSLCGRELHLDFTSSTVKKRSIRTLRDALKSATNRDTYPAVATLFQQLEVHQPSEPPAAYRPMAWADLKRLQEMGHEIAPHTCSHRILSRLDDNEARQEIEGSRDAIVRKLGSISPVFGYPTGRAEDFTQRDMQLVEAAGMICAASTVPGYITSDHQARNDWYALPRFSMPDNMAEFIQCATWIERAKEKLRSFSSGA